MIINISSSCPWNIYSVLRGNGGGDRLSNVALFNLSPLCLKKGIFINSLSLSWNVSGNTPGNGHFLQKYEYVPISRCFWNTYIQHWGGMGVVTDWVIDRRSIPRHPLVASTHTCYNNTSLVIITFSNATVVVFWICEHSCILWVLSKRCSTGQPYTSNW